MTCICVQFSWLALGMDAEFATLKGLDDCNYVNMRPVDYKNVRSLKTLLQSAVAIILMES